VKNGILALRCAQGVEYCPVQSFWNISAGVVPNARGVGGITYFILILFLLFLCLRVRAISSDSFAVELARMGICVC